MIDELTNEIVDEGYENLTDSQKIQYWATCCKIERSKSITERGRLGHFKSLVQLFQGKFAMVKHENNKLRARVKNQAALIEDLRQETGTTPDTEIYCVVSVEITREQRQEILDVLQRICPNGELVIACPSFIPLTNTGAYYDFDLANSVSQMDRQASNLFRPEGCDTDINTIHDECGT